MSISEIQTILMQHGWDKKAALFTAYAIRDGETTLQEALSRV
ncbi:hypothetical protein [Thiomicrospira sp.]